MKEEFNSQIFTKLEEINFSLNSQVLQTKQASSSEKVITQLLMSLKGVGRGLIAKLHRDPEVELDRRKRLIQPESNITQCNNSK